MELTLKKALEKGIEAHRAGKVQEADQCYTAILKAQPNHPDANHNMGVLAVGIGKVQEALPFFKNALETNPNKAQFWLSYIDALIKLNKIDDAKSALDQAKSNGKDGDRFSQIEHRLFDKNKNIRVDVTSVNLQEPLIKQMRPLMEQYSKGNYQQVKNQASQLLTEFPNSFNLFNIRGAANQFLGRFNEAIKDYKKAIDIKPNCCEVYNNLGIVLQTIEEQEEAMEAFKTALSIKPDYADAYNNMGISLQKQAKLDEAIEAFKTALSIKPNYADAYNNMGVSLKDHEMLEEAIEAFKTSLSIKPDYANAYNNMGNALADQGKQDEAIDAYNQALSVKPDYAEAYINIGHAFTDQGKKNEAIEAYNQALSIKPDHSDAHRSLSLINKCSTNDPRLLQVQNLLSKEGITDQDKCNFNFALTKMYEDIGKLDKAFQHLSKANALRKKLLNYCIDQDEKLFSELRVAETKISKNIIGLKKVSADITPIFILGMPRSGTTLVEQIISSHSEVNGAGELEYVKRYGLKLATGCCPIDTQSTFEFRRKYLLALSKVSNNKKFVTDKMPQNFQFIPLICAALPEAKIIHIKRDPKATAWSNYRHYFTTKDLGYCYNITDIISYYKLYFDLLQVWISKYGNRIYNLSYEKLTTNQENETRELINYLKLTWEDGCMFPHKNRRSVRTASQQQIRQKIYQGSSQEWRKYEPYINDIFESLPSL